MHAFLTDSIAFSQTNKELLNRIELLERRVTQLEKQNNRLRASSVQKYLDQAKDGESFDIRDGDKLLAKFVIGKENWGESNSVDVAAVAKSVASEIFQDMKPNDTPTIIVLRSDHGPIALSQRGPNDEYIVLLNSINRRWAQLSYQLAHELGHVLCGELNENAPQHWFEESFCEAVSIWTLERMAETWKDNAPYDSWRSYSASLQKYAKSVRESVQSPKELAAWIAKHQSHLSQTPYDRPKNRVVALQILELAEKDDSVMRSFRFLRTKKPAKNSMTDLLKSWKDGCPATESKVPLKIAKVLGL